MDYFKRAWRDYVELCNGWSKWIKNYWVLYIIITFILFVPFIVCNILEQRYVYTFTYTVKKEEEE